MKQILIRIEIKSSIFLVTIPNIINKDSSRKYNLNLKRKSTTLTSSLSINTYLLLCRLSKRECFIKLNV